MIFILKACTSPYSHAQAETNPIDQEYRDVCGAALLRFKEHTQSELDIQLRALESAVGETPANMNDLLFKKIEMAQFLTGDLKYSVTEQHQQFQKEIEELYHSEALAALEIQRQVEEKLQAAVSKIQKSGQNAVNEMERADSDMLSAIRWEDIKKRYKFDMKFFEKIVKKEDLSETGQIKTFLDSLQIQSQDRDYAAPITSKELREALLIQRDDHHTELSIRVSVIATKFYKRFKYLQRKLGFTSGNAQASRTQLRQFIAAQEGNIAQRLRDNGT